MSLTKQDLADINKIVVSGINQALTEFVIPRFDEFDNRFDQIDKRFDRLEERVSKIENQLIDLETRMAAQEGLMRETNRRLNNIEGRLKAVENDIVELYAMIGRAANFKSKNYEKLSDEEKIRTLYKETLKLAKHTGVSL